MAEDQRDEPRGLGLLTRMARQRGVVIVSSSGSDRSSGCAESPERYDVATALQVCLLPLVTSALTMPVGQKAWGLGLDLGLGLCIGLELG